MMEFLKAGGFAIWYVLALSLSLLAICAHFAYRPRAKQLALVRGLTWALVFGIASAVATNVLAVFSKVPNNEEWAHSPDMPLIVMVGLGEAITPAVLGFTFLSLSWLLVAFGMRREVDAEYPQP
jgi:hypothetical protein